MTFGALTGIGGLLGSAYGFIGTSVYFVLGGAPLAHAKAPMLNTPAPAFYRFKLGSIEATVVSDGPLSIGDPKNTFRGPTAEEIGKMMSDHFLPTNNVVLDQNVLVINTGDKLALFETGMSSVKRTDAMGQLAANLKKSGIDARFQGYYVPYWTFDSLTFNSYTGERGEHYWVTVGSGKNQRREPTRNVSPDVEAFSPRGHAGWTVSQDVT